MLIFHDFNLILKLYRRNIHTLSNKIPTFMVEKQISHKIFGIAFEKRVFLPGSGSGSILKSNLDPDPN